MRTVMVLTTMVGLLLAVSAFPAEDVSAQSSPAAKAAEQPNTQSPAVPPAGLQSVDKSKWEPLPPLQTNPAVARARKNQPAGPPRGAALRAALMRADADRNGQVTFEEAAAVLPDLTKERFAQLDRNGDGVLTAADRTAGPPPGPGQRLRALCERADKDGNKQVTFEELSAVDPTTTRQQFDQWDRNKDGVLSEADRPNQEAQGPGRLRALLKRADANGDRQVTFDELSAVAPNITHEQFNIWDNNGDGVISQADCQAEAPARRNPKPADTPQPSP